jgi:hypothetical protein
MEFATAWRRRIPSDHRPGLILPILGADTPTLAVYTLADTQPSALGSALFSQSIAADITQQPKPDQRKNRSDGKSSIKKIEPQPKDSWGIQIAISERSVVFRTYKRQRHSANQAVLQ